ncbi:unnamed protein product, partial [Symbiodinium sp. KB8]
ADVLDLLGAAREHFQQLPTLVEIQVPSDSALHVVGDLHGQSLGPASAFVVWGLGFWGLGV